MRKYTIKQVDAFTTKMFGGNPAAVVPSAKGLSDQEMLLIAKEMNLSETAFILPSNKADFRIRWFTPKKEVLFCGHATIASLHVLAEEGKFGIKKKGNYTFNIETLIGILQVEVEKTQNTIKIILQSPKIELFKEDLNISSLADALNIKLEDINNSYPIMRDKTVDYLFIVLKNLEILKKIDYDYNRLEKFGNQYQVKGFTLLTTETFDKDSQVHSRFFTPFYGIKEDPVTGSSQGPLGVYYVLNNIAKLNNQNLVEIKSEQGDIMGRPGRLIIKVNKNSDGTYTSKLISQAITVLTGELIFS
jgi:trans-2,3-dihydro-3-hydroxyanthranilate isomerase